MNYVPLKRNSFTSGSYALVPLREEDIQLIRQWRNDQIHVLRQKAMLTEVDQHQYFKNVVQPSFSAERPSLMLFSYLEGEKCIGYGGLTNIDWEARRAELSFLLDTALSRNTPAYEEAFRMYLSLVKQVAFEDLMFNRIFTETFDVRPHHVRVLEQCGFRREGVMKQHAVVNGHFVDSIIHGYLREYYDAERSAGIC